MPSSSRTSVALTVALLAGCAGARPRDMWVMPLSPDPAPAGAARESGGYPFSYASNGVAGADDTSEEQPRGDLPESAYHRPAAFWRRDEAAARREAQATRRGILVSFFAEWSDDCRQLEDDTLLSPEVRGAIRQGYVPLRIDVTEETRAGRELLERYRVDQLPAIILLDAQGHELDRINEFVTQEALLDRLAKSKR
jgi:hypothetical protein